MTRECLATVRLHASARTAKDYEAITANDLLAAIGTKEIKRLQPADVGRVSTRMAEKGPLRECPACTVTVPGLKSSR